MPTFVHLMKLTADGIKSIRELPEARQAYMQLGQQFGVTIKSVYYTIGEYDAVITVEAPDAETVSAMALTIGSIGKARTVTLHAYTPDEMDEKILSKIPG